MDYDMKEPYVNKDGKVVRVNAATCHHISEYGGIEKFIKKVQRDAIAEYRHMHQDNRINHVRTQRRNIFHFFKRH